MAKAPDETLKHPILGVLKWDAERNHWLQQHETSPRGRLLDVQIEPGDRERRTLLKRAADLYLWALKNEPRVLRQAVEAYLLELYNDGWREEEDPELTAEEFEAELGGGLLILSDSEFAPVQFWYSDGPRELFGGHAVVVELDAELKHRSAHLVG